MTAATRLVVRVGGDPAGGAPRREVCGGEYGEQGRARARGFSRWARERGHGRALAAQGWPRGGLRPPPPRGCCVACDSRQRSRNGETVPSPRRHPRSTYSTGKAPSAGRGKRCRPKDFRIVPVFFWSWPRWASPHAMSRPMRRPPRVLPAPHRPRPVGWRAPPTPALAGRLGHRRLGGPSRFARPPDGAGSHRAGVRGAGSLLSLR